MDAAVTTSDLSLRRLAHVLGTSLSRCAFLLRAERIADALRLSRQDGIPTILDAMESTRRADSKHDDDWAYVLALAHGPDSTLR